MGHCFQEKSLRCFYRSPCKTVLGITAHFFTAPFYVYLPNTHRIYANRLLFLELNATWSDGVMEHVHIHFYTTWTKTRGGIRFHWKLSKKKKNLIYMCSWMQVGTLTDGLGQTCILHLTLCSDLATWGCKDVFGPTVSTSLAVSSLFNKAKVKNPPPKRKKKCKEAQVFDSWGRYLESSKSKTQSNTF